jgi:hypothetical protein
VPDLLKNGDVITVNLANGSIIREGSAIAQMEPLSQVQLDIYHAGDLFAYARKLEK